MDIAFEDPSKAISPRKLDELIAANSREMSWLTFYVDVVRASSHVDVGD